MRKIGKFRFYVGDEERRVSSSYSIVNRGADAYVIGRSLGGVIKLSIHSSGICGFGFESDYWERNFRGPRQLSARWKRAAPSESEYVVAAILRFATRYLRASHEVPVRPKMVCLKPPAEGHCLDVVIVIGSSSISGSESHFQKCTLLHKTDLSKQETLFVFSQKHSHRENLEGVIETMNAPGPRLESKKIGEMPAGSALDHLHAVVGNNPVDGEPIILSEISGIKFTKH